MSQADPRRVRLGVLLVLGAALLTTGLAGCGGSAGPNGSSSTTTGAVPARGCDVGEALGEFYSAEVDLYGIKGNLRSALAGSQTVPIHPGGHARIRTYSNELLHSIYREVRGVRKVLRSCCPGPR